MMILATAIADPVLLIIAGFAAGVIGGMVGIGGGILIVPALIYTAGLGERAAVATSLAAMVPMSIVAAARLNHYGKLRLREGLTLGGLGVVGAAIGATLADVLPESALRIGFSILMIAIATQMLVRVYRERRAGRDGGDANAAAPAGSAGAVADVAAPGAANGAGDGPGVSPARAQTRT